MIGGQTEKRRGRPRKAPKLSGNTEAAEDLTPVVVEQPSVEAGDGQAAEDPSVPAVRRSPTKPWEKKDNLSNKPWKQDFFKVKLKRDGFHVRFVNPGNVEKRLDMGYEIADPAHYGGVEDRVIDDGSPLGRRVERRGMVLMEIPDEGVKYYQDIHRQKIKRMKRDAKDLLIKKAKEQLEKVGVKVIIEDDSKNF